MLQGRSCGEASGGSPVRARPRGALRRARGGAGSARPQCTFWAPVTELNWPYVWVYFWASHSVPLICVEHSMPMSHCCNFCSSVTYIEIGVRLASSFDFILKIALVILFFFVVVVVLYKLKDYLLYFFEKCLWNCDWDCAESVDFFGGVQTF